MEATKTVLQIYSIIMTFMLACFLFARMIFEEDRDDRVECLTMLIFEIPVLIYTFL